MSQSRELVIGPLDTLSQANAKLKKDPLALGKALGNLMYSVDQLCSDVEFSSSGMNGAHRQAIARVRACQQRVRDENYEQS